MPLHCHIITNTCKAYTLGGTGWSVPEWHHLAPQNPFLSSCLERNDIICRGVSHLDPGRLVTINMPPILQDDILVDLGPGWHLGLPQIYQTQSHPLWNKSEVDWSRSGSVRVRAIFYEPAPEPWGSVQSVVALEPAHQGSGSGRFGSGSHQGAPRFRGNNKTEFILYLRCYNKIL